MKIMNWIIACLALGGMALGCRVNSDNVEAWKGTVKGPSKITAVLLADKYPAELRAQAAVALIEMERQDVDGVEALLKALPQLDETTARAVMAELVPAVEKRLREGNEQPEGQEPVPLQIRMKDAAYRLVQTGLAGEQRDRLVKALVGWYVHDFNGRSLAGNATAEQVIRSLGSKAANMLVDALHAKLPSQALTKIAELIGRGADAASKEKAAERLLEIEREMLSEEYLKWLDSKVIAQLEERAPGQKVDPARVRKVALLNRDNFINESILPAMKHVADQPPVADRLMSIASKPNDTEIGNDRRARALQALEGKVTSKHLQPLLGLALDPKSPPAVRDYAFDRVGDIGSEAALGPMWGLVQGNKDARLRWRAGELVLGIGGNRVLAEFLARLPGDAEYPPEELEGYAARLGQMSPMPTELMRNQLQSPQWWARVLALKYFERKGTERDIPALRSLKNDGTPVKGKGWEPGQTVGKVAEGSIAGIQQRLGLPTAPTPPKKLKS